MRLRMSPTAGFGFISCGDPEHEKLHRISGASPNWSMKWVSILFTADVSAFLRRRYKTGGSIWRGHQRESTGMFCFSCAPMAFAHHITGPHGRLPHLALYQSGAPPAPSGCFHLLGNRPNLRFVTGGLTAMQTRVRKVAHVLERLGLAMAGAASGLFVAALVGTSHPALTNQAFLLLMMIGGAVGFYLGIDTPPLPFNHIGTAGPPMASGSARSIRRNCSARSAPFSRHSRRSHASV